MGWALCLQKWGKCSIVVLYRGVLCSRYVIRCPRDEGWILRTIVTESLRRGLKLGLRLEFGVEDVMRDS